MDASVKPCPKGHQDRNARGECKPCKVERDRKWALANREATRAASRKWRQTHLEVSRARGRAAMQKAYWADPEKHREAVRQSVRKHPEAAKLRTQEWRAANPDRVRATANKHYRNNLESERAKRRENYRKNPQAYLDRNANRLALLQERGDPSLRIIKNTSRYTLADCTTDDGRCYLCGVRAATSPHHLLPLARGGFDILSNLFGACDECQRSCGSKTYAEWLVYWPKSSSYHDLQRSLN